MKQEPIQILVIGATDMHKYFHLISNATLSIALACLSGCAIFTGTYIHEEPIGEERVQAIKPGKTNIREILTLLGPPIAVARPGKPITCPHITANACGIEVSSDGFFELFTSSQMLHDHDVIYYYQASRLTTSGFLFFLLIANGGKILDSNKAEQLWLLVNEDTGVVKALTYRPG